MRDHVALFVDAWTAHGGPVAGAYELVEDRFLLVDADDASTGVSVCSFDALTRSTLQEELSRIWDETRKTVIMITNDVDEAVLLADRIFPLTKGPGATLGPEIPVNIPRPRRHRTLSGQAGYKQVRAAIVEFLLKNRDGVGHSRESGNPVLKIKVENLDSRFRGNDAKVASVGEKVL